MGYIKHRCPQCGSHNLTPFDKRGNACKYICEECGTITDRLVYYETHKD